MSKLNITKGEAIALLGKEDRFAKVEIGHRTIDLKSMELPSAKYKQENANAELIADAFNTANKCDMLPNELLAQRDEFLDALSLIVSTNGDIAINDPIWIHAKTIIQYYEK